MKNITYYIQIKFIIFLVIFITIISSCKKDTKLENTPVLIDYVTLEIGNYIDYSVTEINIDKKSNVFDTTNYFIREIITEKFTDLANNEAYRLERFIKLNENENWIIKDVWTAQILDNSFQKVEENIRYKKIIFPLEIGKTWNGNIFNALDVQNYEISSFDEAETINTFEFDSVLTVTQEDELNMIEKKYSVEKFAKNLGLIYKENTFIYSENTSSGLPIEQRAELANILIMKVINYGSN